MPRARPGLRVACDRNPFFGWNPPGRERFNDRLYAFKFVLGGGGGGGTALPEQVPPLEAEAASVAVASL